MIVNKNQAIKDVTIPKNKLWLILGILLISIAGVGAEIYFGIDDIGSYFIFNRILPSQMISVLIGADAVLNVSLDDGNTQVWYNETYYLDQDLSPSEITDYLKGIDYLFTSNDYSTITFPGYQFPECHWDYGLNKVIGVYWFNKTQIPIEDDPKCS